MRLAPAIPTGSSGRSRRCSAFASLEARPQRVVLGDRLRPARDPAGGLETRDLRDEVRAREPELRRERRAVTVERRLLGDRGPTERAAHGDAPERPRRPAELPFDDRGVIHAAEATGGLVVPAPGGDAPDDVEPLAGLDEAEPPSLANERVALADASRSAARAAASAARASPPRSRDGSARPGCADTNGAASSRRARRGRAHRAREAGSGEVAWTKLRAWDLPRPPDGGAGLPAPPPLTAMTDHAADADHLSTAQLTTRSHPARNRAPAEPVRIPCR